MANRAAWLRSRKRSRTRAPPAIDLPAPCAAGLPCRSWRPVSGASSSISSSAAAAPLSSTFEMAGSDSAADSERQCSPSWREYAYSSR